MKCNPYADGHYDPSSTCETIQVDTSPAVPTDFLAPFRQLLSRAARQGLTDISVVPYVRVSSDKQRRYGNLDDQLIELRHRIDLLGRLYGVSVNVVGDFDFGEDVSAWKLWKSARTELVKAAKLAQEHNAVIVATDTTRYLRNKHHSRGVEPTVDDFERLQGIVGNVKLATIRYPDYGEARSRNTARGIRAKDKSPGYKTRRQEEYQCKVRRAYWKGMSIREIATKFDIPKSTVGEWVRD